MEDTKIICNQPKEHDCDLEDAPTIECICRGCTFYTKVGPWIEMENKEQKTIETLKKALKDCLLQKQPVCPGPDYYWTRGCWKRKPGHAFDTPESSVLSSEVKNDISPCQTCAMSLKGTHCGIVQFSWCPDLPQSGKERRP